MKRTYAIGDIHGCLDKLRNLVALCERDLAAVAGAREADVTFVFLGDYIDRGPDSRGVLQYLMDLRQREDRCVITLMGNHEAMALDVLEGILWAGNWLGQGGAETLRSYGADRPHELPLPHVAFLQSLRLSYDDGDRLFVHAGVNPERSLDDQRDQDLLWIREPFLSDARNYGRLIVHGHSPVSAGKPDLRANRLNLDTGAVYGGPLTAAVFGERERDPLGFLQAE